LWNIQHAVNLKLTDALGFLVRRDHFLLVPSTFLVLTGVGERVAVPGKGVKLVLERVDIQDQLTIGVRVAKRDNVLHRKMEIFDSLMPITMDEGDIGEHSNNRHKGPIGWHCKLVLGSILRNDTKERSWRLKHVYSTTVLCVLV
jgi:hypothetical protein